MLSLFVTIEHGLPQPASMLALEPIPRQLPVNLRLKSVPVVDQLSGLQGYMALWQTDR